MESNSRLAAVCSENRNRVNRIRAENDAVGLHVPDLNVPGLNVPGLNVSGLNVPRANALRRRGIAHWAVISAASAVLLLAVSGVWYRVSTVSRQRMFDEKIAEARRHLQLSRDAEALDTLSLPSVSDAPPEFRYLKALTLDRLNRYEPASAEIRQAIEEAPDNPKYKGLELKMRMLERERSAIDQLIELNREHASTAAVALFAAYGFQAKGILLETEGKPKAAKYHRKRRTQTLDTALTMSGDIPELHPELISFAIREEKSGEALRLIDGLLELEPESVSLRSRKVRVLVALKKMEPAAELAKELYEETGKHLEGAKFLASVLSQTRESREHVKLFEQLVERFPRSSVVVSKFALYLTRFGRLPAAQKQIEDAIERQTDASERQILAFTAITLPIEVNAPGVAEEFLRKHRKHLQDDLLVDYFEARILYLRKQYGEAVRRMLKIVAAAKEGQGDSRIFATEALTWVKRILADKVMTEQFDRVLNATKESASESVPAQAPQVKVATEEQLQALQQKTSHEASRTTPHEHSAGGDAAASQEPRGNEESAAQNAE